MRRILILLAAAVALTGCKIEEAEYFDPTADGYRMLQSANRHLTEAAAAASRAMLFNLYYSASDEERKTLYDRYFYTSRIVDSGNGEWRIIDRDGELVILTGGQPLATDGHDFAANNRLLLKNLEGTTDRRARFRTVIALILNGEEHLFEGIVEGRIIDAERGAEGFGYDPLFIPDGGDKTFAEMSAEEKNAVSHRGRAVRRLAAYLHSIEK